MIVKVMSRVYMMVKVMSRKYMTMKEMILIIDKSDDSLDSASMNIVIVIIYHDGGMI